MKTETLKKVILGLLILVVAYVWYGNIALFSSSGSYSDSHQNNEVSASQSSSTATGTEIVFQTPKINPFAKPKDATQSNNTRSTQKRPQKIAQPKGARPSTLYHLVGTLSESSSGFVALADSRGNQILIQRGDSLSGWVARRIRKNQIIFAQDKFRDTLQLKTINLQ
ncbi:hypothetical protein JYU19_01990 [bacterium AH-315-J21]|nr:hypothetical protein [bacterium AH-315-J21]